MLLALFLLACSGMPSLRAARTVPVGSGTAYVGEARTLTWRGRLPLVDRPVSRTIKADLEATGCSVVLSAPLLTALELEMLRHLGTTSLAGRPVDPDRVGPTEHPELIRTLNGGCWEEALAIPPRELNRYDRETRRALTPPPGPDCRKQSRPYSKSCYRQALWRVHGWDTSPERLQAWAVEELERVHADLARRTGHATPEEALDWLRDGGHAFESQETMLHKAREDVRRAERVTPWSTDRCATKLSANNIGSYREGYWQVDGDWTTAYRYVSRPLAHHECYPGHHLQHQLLVDPPRVREGDHWGFVEGWGMFAEQVVAREWGLYSDEDEVGLLVYQAWRVTRVIADVGYWAEGWSPEQVAEAYERGTPLPARHIAIEVDRITGDPGHYTAHAVGYQHFLAIREALPEDVDLDAFYGMLLSEGPTTLPMLRLRAQAWLREEHLTR